MKVSKMITSFTTAVLLGAILASLILKSFISTALTALNGTIASATRF
jgi:hypothetical protein